MNTVDFLRIFEEIVENEGEEITASTPLNAVKGWDSLAVVGLISRLDLECGVRISAGQLSTCSTVGDIAALALVR